MEAVPELVDHLFRRQAGRMVSTLTAIFGTRNLQLAEDVVQEALMRALQVWPFQGVPRNPEAWLVQVARNLALDRLRRQTALAARIPELERRMNLVSAAGPLDEQLAMMFLCCHTGIPEYARLPLTLKIVAGFSVAEIARALLSTEDAIAQRIVRAKRYIRSQNLSMELPDASELPLRLDSVLEALYLLFNEGYSASTGEFLIRRDLCEEAIYLTSLLVTNPATALPKVHALLALQLFQAARFDARTDSSGDLLLLEEQDRALWNRAHIQQAFHHLDASSSGDELTVYHVQAAIAAAHASAPSLDGTDWPHILSLYDQLVELNPSPVVLLNRAVVVARCHGTAAAFEAVATVQDHPALANYYLLPAVLAHLHLESGDTSAARACLRHALRCRANAAERRHLERRLASASSPLS